MDDQAPSLQRGQSSSYFQMSSPLLQFDPRAINPTDSEWIFPDGAINRPSRGRFELAFSQIGGSVMIGGAMGSAVGGYNGLRMSHQLGTKADPVSWSIKRSHILNYVTKNGANSANSFGVIAVIYSSIGVALGLINESKDDINTVVSGVTTGLLYGAVAQPRSPATNVSEVVATKVVNTMANRMRRSAIGGLIGTALSLSYVLLNSNDPFK